MRISPRSLILAFAAGALLAPAAEAAPPTTKAEPQASAAAVRYPVITRIAPRKLAVGDTLTVYGRYFRSKRSTVVFYRAGHPAVFLRADSATKNKLTVVVGRKVMALFADAPTVPQMVRLRVIGTKMSKSWTKNSTSPTIVPPAAPQPEATPPAAAPKATPDAPAPAPAPDASAPAPAPDAPVVDPIVLCQQQAALDPAGDRDGDGLLNGFEAGNSLDPCVADTDGDSVPDGFEYRSALDLNNSPSNSYPYPGKKPWPNPLDPTDAGNDFDGDGLMLQQEYRLWKYTGSRLPLNYSDGRQFSDGTVFDSQLDTDGNGQITQDEMDADADGLSNMVEFNNQGQMNWWLGVYRDEKPYSRRQFYAMDAVDPDIDGDGVLDGNDDQDNDGYDNINEMQYARWRADPRFTIAVSSGSPIMFVNPFNPCLPNPQSATCSRYIPMDPSEAWPPFDASYARYKPSARGVADGAVMPFLVNPAVDLRTTPRWDGRGGLAP